MQDIINNFENCKVGQLVRVNDIDLLIELNAEKLPDFLIKDRREYNESFSHYIILTLDHVGTDKEYLLVCDIFQDICDVRFYSQPEFFNPDKRSILQEGSNNWLFDFEAYPDEIYSGDDVFTKKFKNESFGDVAVVEWETDSKIVNYNLLLIETGIQHKGGGWVEFYEGRQIRETEVIF